MCLVSDFLWEFHLTIDGWEFEEFLHVLRRGEKVEFFSENQGQVWAPESVSFFREIHSIESEVL